MSYVFARDVSNLNIKYDVIIVGDKLCGALNLNDREMVDAEFSVNPTDISEKKGKFDALKKLAKSY